MEENKYIVKKISVMDTLRNLPVGKPVIFDCRELCAYGTALSAVCRLNSANADSYRLITDDNGVTFTITRLK